MSKTGQQAEMWVGMLESLKEGVMLGLRDNLYKYSTFLTKFLNFDFAYIYIHTCVYMNKCICIYLCII